MLATLVLLLAAASVSAELASHRITPVESVINLLDKLQEQTKEEGKKEAAAYDKFACFCKSQSDEKLYSITKKGEKMELLTAEIKELAGAITKLSQEIAEMEVQVAALEKKVVAEQKIMDAAQNEYTILKADL